MIPNSVGKEDPVDLVKTKELSFDFETNADSTANASVVSDKADAPDTKSTDMVFERRSSQVSIVSNCRDSCRICHCEGDSAEPLIAPCLCMGSLRYVHQMCLQQWIKSSDIKCCELCKFEFIMQSKYKPFRKWEKLDMSAAERRKIMCSVLFHVVAVTCVIWSLYVLIDRTAHEISHGMLEWPFWTKLIIVAIGFTGCLVFMYVQCKIYVQLFARWRAYNREIYLQNAPEKPKKPALVSTQVPLMSPKTSGLQSPAGNTTSIENEQDSSSGTKCLQFRSKKNSVSTTITMSELLLNGVADHKVLENGNQEGEVKGPSEGQVSSPTEVVIDGCKGLAQDGEVFDDARVNNNCMGEFDNHVVGEDRLNPKLVSPTMPEVS